jgi:hypothetical protein
MADGEVVGRSEVLNSLLDQSSRLGAIEKLVEERPSFKQLMDSNNDLRREISAKIDKVEEARTKADDARAEQQKAQLENLKLTLGNQQSAMIAQAVASALEANRVQETRAREDVKNKAQDTVQGVQLFVKSQGWLNVILLIALIVMGANQYWKLF